MQQSIEVNKELLTTCLTSPINVEKVRALLQNGADPNYSGQCDLFPNVSNNPDYSFPVLHAIAGKENSVEVAKLLIQAGAELDKVDTCIMNTPLLTAIALRDQKLAAFFSSEITSSNKAEHRKVLSQQDAGRECQNTPLGLTLKKDMDELALLLIQSGADVNVTCRNHETALHWACMLRKNDIIQALIKHGAKTDKINCFGRTASEYYSYQVGLIDITCPIETYGERVCRANLQEFSDLYFHTAEYNRDYLAIALQDRIERRNAVKIDSELVKLLGEINGTASMSLPQQHSAIIKNQYEKIKALTSRFNSAIYLPSDGRNKAAALNKIVDEVAKEIKNARFKDAPLSRAVKEFDREGVQKLLASHTNVNAQCTDGFTALHWAAMRRDNELIKQLIAEGADSTIKNKWGRTPLDYYTYQIKAADFKGHLDEKLYRELSLYNPELALGDTEMPEFKEAYWNEPMIFFGTKNRNKKPIDLSLFQSKSSLNSTNPEQQPQTSISSLEVKKSLGIVKEQQKKSEEEFKPIQTINPFIAFQSSTTDKKITGKSSPAPFLKAERKEAEKMHEDIICLTCGHLKIQFKRQKDVSCWELRVLNQNFEEQVGMYFHNPESIAKIKEYLNGNNLHEFIDYIEAKGASAKNISQYLKAEINNMGSQKLKP